MLLLINSYPPRPEILLKNPVAIDAEPSGDAILAKETLFLAPFAENETRTFPRKGLIDLWQYRSIRVGATSEKWYINPGIWARRKSLIGRQRVVFDGKGHILKSDPIRQKSIQLIWNWISFFLLSGMVWGGFSRDSEAQWSRKAAWSLPQGLQRKIKGYRNNKEENYYIHTQRVLSQYAWEISTRCSSVCICPLYIRNNKSFICFNICGFRDTKIIRARPATRLFPYFFFWVFEIFKFFILYANSRGFVFLIL